MRCPREFDNCRLVKVKELFTLMKIDNCSVTHYNLTEEMTKFANKYIYVKKDREDVYRMFYAVGDIADEASINPVYTYTWNKECLLFNEYAEYDCAICIYQGRKKCQKCEDQQYFLC